MSSPGAFNQGHLLAAMDNENLRDLGLSELLRLRLMAKFLSHSQYLLYKNLNLVQIKR